MLTTLSSKGQVVLPKQARNQLRLRPGVQLKCVVQGDSILLTPERKPGECPLLFQDPKSGLTITQSPPDAMVTSEEVRAAMQDFP